MGWGGMQITWGGNLPIAVGLQTATQSPIAPLLDDPFAEFDFLLEGSAYKRNFTSAWPGTWGGMGAWGSTNDIDMHSSMIRYSWRGLVTGASDTPAHTYIPSALVDPVNFEINIPALGSINSAASGFGAVEFVAPDDDDLGYWAGRVFEVKLGGTYEKGGTGEGTIAFNDYTTRWRFYCDDLEYAEDRARMYARNPIERLDVPLQTNTYLGAGTYEGSDEIKGQYKPKIYGAPFNVPAVLVDDTNYVYQINDGAVFDITDVRVNGKAWTDAGDSTDLLNESISASNYKTDKSRGLFRLGSQPDGEVTADASKSTLQGGLVLLEMLNDAGTFDIDTGSFNSELPYDLGVYIGTEQASALELITDIVAHSDSFIYTNRTGQITLGCHPDIENDLISHDIEGRNTGYNGPNVIANISRLPTPPAPSSITVQYRRNWNVQTEDSLDATLTQAQKQPYGIELRNTAVALNNGAINFNPSAPELVIGNGYIQNQADAITMRTNMINRVGQKRDLFSVEITAPQFQIIPGQIVRIFHDRFDLSNGKRGEVLRLVESATTTTLEVLMLS